MKYCKRCNYSMSNEEYEKYDGICKNCHNEKQKPRNKKIIVALIIISIVIILAIFPIIINNIKLSNLKNELQLNIEKNTIHKYEYCNNITLEGYYNDIVSITMHENFDDLNYEEKEKVILEINSNINNEFKNYITKRSELEKSIEINNMSCKIDIYINDDCYKFNTNTKTITKNDKEYNLLINLKEQINNKIQDIGYKTYLDNITDTDSLKNIISLENITECKKEIIYLSASKLYKDGYFEDAVNQFNKIDGDYKEKNNYLKNCEILNSIQGTFRASYIKLIVINKWNITFGIDPKYNTNNALNEYSFTYKIENNELVLTRKRTIREIGNGICERYKIDINNKTITGNEYETYYYESNNLYFPEKLKEPKIGMTKTEVENSTWGKPNKINKTTTAYGTREQWLYGNGRYLYFENGKLTSIQN